MPIYIIYTNIEQQLFELEGGYNTTRLWQAYKKLEHIDKNKYMFTCPCWQSSTRAQYLGCSTLSQWRHVRPLEAPIRNKFTDNNIILIQIHM